jgi:hypothetical protein
LVRVRVYMGEEFEDEVLGFESWRVRVGSVRVRVHMG